MPVWLEWIVYILIVIVMLGVLIAIHEAGHLATAKMFRVYCFEYSIGMGPKVFSKKKKNGETYFSIRAVPFGGFVSMYGEPGAVPEGFEEPPQERSLEHIAKWKKCIILVAGVTLNFILGLVLIYVGDQFCPIFYSGYYGAEVEGKMTTTLINTSYDFETISYIDAHKPAGKEKEWETKDYLVSLPVYDAPVPTQKDAYSTVQILACGVHLYTDATMTTRVNEIDYVACYSPSTLIDNHGLGDSLVLFPKSAEAVPSAMSIYGVTALPQVFNDQGLSNAFDPSTLNDGVTINLPVQLMYRKAAKDVEHYKENLICLEKLTLSKKGKVFAGESVTVNIIKVWNNWGEAWQRWAADVPQACSAIVRGFASLFTPNGWKNISGIIGITAAMPQINAAGGARMVFFFAGMISINLAFFNLLPFPGLDGWQLLVTVIEGITKKKVPAKIQGIVSFVGIALLFGLMILIAVKDVIQLI